MICSKHIPTKTRMQLILEYINVIIYTLIAYPHNLRIRKLMENDSLKPLSIWELSGDIVNVISANNSFPITGSLHQPGY